MMNLATEIFGDVIVVHTPEELSADQAEAFEAYLPSLDRRQIVLDLDGTETLDSRGLAAMLNTQDKLRDLGGDVKLASSNPTNRKILEITRLDQQLEVFENLVDAVRSFR
jgi:anti-sigma B factor antagonist